jgi:hypothetical protein
MFEVVCESGGTASLPSRMSVVYNFDTRKAPGPSDKAFSHYNRNWGKQNRLPIEALRCNQGMLFQ